MIIVLFTLIPRGQNYQGFFINTTSGVSEPIGINLDQTSTYTLPLIVRLNDMKMMALRVFLPQHAVVIRK